MATITDSVLLKGFRGRLGKTFVFKTLRNKTVVTPYTLPRKKQSESQKANRTRFAEAAAWAQIILKVPERKTYYQKKALKLGLPNAYTAAITDYMRKPLIHETAKSDGTKTYTVYKNDFALKNAEVSCESDNINSFIVSANSKGECFISLSNRMNTKLTFIVVDDTGQRMYLSPS